MALAHRSPPARSRMPSQPADHARLHGTERHAGGRRDLRLALLEVEAPAQQVGLLGGQPGELAAIRQCSSRSSSARLVGAVGERDRAGRVARLGDAPAQLVDRPAARDREQPGEQAAALRVVAVGALPGLEEDLLLDVLGRGALAEHAQRKPNVARPCRS